MPKPRYPIDSEIVGKYFCRIFDDYSWDVREFIGTIQTYSLGHQIAASKRRSPSLAHARKAVEKALKALA